MSAQASLYVAPLVVSAAIMLWLARYAGRQRQVPGARAFAACALLDALWAGANAVEIVVPDLSTKLLFANLQYVSYTFLPVLWLVMALQFTGRSGLLKRGSLHRLARPILLLIVPIVTNVLVWTNDLHGLVRSAVNLEVGAGVAVLAKTPGPWFWVHSAYCYGLLAISLWLLAVALFRQYPIYHGQTLALMLGVFLPTLGSAVFVFDATFGAGVLRFDPAPVLSGVSGLIIAWALFRFHLFAVVPLAQERIVAGLADGVVVVDLRERVVSLNPAAEALLGISTHRAVGRPCAEVLAGTPALATLDGAGSARADVRLAPAGEVRHYEVRASPLRDGFGRIAGRIVVFHDVTDLRAAVEGLREAERRYRELTELLPVPVFEMDERLIVTFANRALYDALGYDESDLARGFRASDGIAPADRERAATAIRALFAGERPPIQEYEYVRKDGSTFPTVVHSSPVVRDGRIVGLRGVVVDLTESKAQEAAREEQLSLISHDLRNPIAVAAGHAEWLQRRLAAQGLVREAQSAEIALKSARQASAMIRELVDVARLESGKLAIRPLNVDVGGLVAEVVARAVPPEDRPRVRCEVPSDLPFSLDPDRIERVLANLVGNAIRHSPPDAEVVVQVARENGSLVVSVADRGEGVDPADLPRVFDRYYQAAAGRQSGDGLGLGLYISRLIVEAHGGEIAASSVPGEGATFRFALPG